MGDWITSDILVICLAVVAALPPLTAHRWAAQLLDLLPEKARPTARDSAVVLYFIAIIALAAWAIIAGHFERSKDESARATTRALEDLDRQALGAAAQDFTYHESRAQRFLAQQLAWNAEARGYTAAPFKYRAVSLAADVMSFAAEAEARTPAMPLNDHGDEDGMYTLDVISWGHSVQRLYELRYGSRVRRFVEDARARKIAVDAQEDITLGGAAIVDRRPRAVTDDEKTAAIDEAYRHAKSVVGEIADVAQTIYALSSTLSSSAKTR